MKSESKDVGIKIQVRDSSGCWSGSFSITSVREMSDPLPVNAHILRTAVKEASNPETHIRSFCCAVQAMQIIFPLPDRGGQKMQFVLTFNSAAPVTQVMLDNPILNEPGKTLQDLLFITVKFQLPVSVAGENWPGWIDSANSHIENLSNKNRIKVTPAQFVTDYLKLNKPQTGDELIFDAEGMVIRGTLIPPWRKEPMAPDLFRFERFSPDANTVEFFLKLRSEVLIRDLTSFQNNLVDCTDEKTTELELPAQNSPAVGLIASALPEVLRWKYENNNLLFSPENPIFDLEIRGSAHATSRIKTQTIQLISNDSGISVLITSGFVPVNNENILTYEFNGVSGKWSGDLTLEIEPESRKSLVQYTAYQPAEENARVWLLTETGPLLLPLPPGGSPDTNYDNDAARLLNGVLRLSVVPWKIMDPEIPRSPAYPDLIHEKKGSLLVINANAVNAEFFFKYDPPGKLTCSLIVVRMMKPEVRLEEFLPVYIPPSFDPFSLAPPELPQPTLPDELAQEANLFYGLSFVEKKSVQSPHISWRLSIDYRPGTLTPEDLTEGSWANTFLKVMPSAGMAEKFLYWYQPKRLPLIPKLPYYQDPSIQPDKRLTGKRLLMPLGLMAGKSIHLKMSESWEVLRIHQGEFSSPVEKEEQPQLKFEWIHLTLPGLLFSIKEESSILILDGNIQDADLLFSWSYELPVLQEVNALRTAGDKKNKDLTPLEGYLWWRKLQNSDVLASTEETLLIDASYPLQNNGMTRPVIFPVENINLITDQKFTGKAYLDLRNAYASMTVLTDNGEELVLISNEKILEGPTIEFKKEIKNELAILKPVSHTGDLQLKAGSLTPFHAASNRFADVFGNQFSALKNNELFSRSIYITHQNSRQEYQLWTKNSLTIETKDISLTLYFIGLPLFLVSSNQYVFDLQRKAINHPLLRDYSWGVIGDISLDGYHLQIFSLDEVLFECNQPERNPYLKRISFSGILHSRPSNIAIGIADRQKVSITLEMTNGQWNVVNVHGKILWPLYHDQPDLGDANNKSEKLYPFIESNLYFNGNLKFGAENDLPKLILPFMDELWEIPVELVSKDNNYLVWNVLPGPPGFFMKPNGGTIYLPLNDYSIITNQINFDLSFLQSNFAGPILDLDLGLAFNNQFEDLRIDRVTLFSKSDTQQLIMAHGSESLQVQLSAQCISIVLNVNEFNSDLPYELLPGWKFEQGNALNVFTSIQFTTNESNQRITSLEVSTAQLVLEGTVSTPDPLDIQITWQQSHSSSDLSMKFTGKLIIPSILTWAVPSVPFPLQHEMIFYPVNATIDNTHLTSSQSPFILFQLSDSVNSKLVEWSSLATHRLYFIRQGNKEILMEWMAPQKIKLASPQGLSQQLFQREPSFKNTGGIEPSRKLAGFQGKSGKILSSYLAGKSTIVFDGTEVFWIKNLPTDDLDLERAQTLLWQDAERHIHGIATAKQDFLTNETEWIRVPFPLINDSAGVLQSVMKNGNKELNDILFNDLIRTKDMQPVDDQSLASLLLKKIIRQQLPASSFVFHSDRSTQSVCLPGWPSTEWFNGFLPYTLFQRRLTDEWLYFEDENTAIYPLSAYPVPSLIKAKDYKKHKDCRKDYWDDEIAPERIWQYDQYIISFENKSQAEYILDIDRDSIYAADFQLYNWGNYDTALKVIIGSREYSITIPAGKKWNTVRLNGISLTSGAHSLVIAGMKNKFACRWIRFSITINQVLKARMDGYQYWETGFYSYGSKKDRAEYVEYEIEIPGKNTYKLVITLESSSKNGWGEFFVNEEKLFAIKPTGKEITLNQEVVLKKGLNSFILKTDNAKKLQVKWIDIEPVVMVVAPPFAATVVALSHLYNPERKKLLAATEIVPLSSSGNELSQQSLQYFKPSPYAELSEKILIPSLDNGSARIRLNVCQLGDDFHTDDLPSVHVLADSDYSLFFGENETWTSLFNEPLLENESLQSKERKKMINWINRLSVSSSPLFFRVQAFSQPRGLPPRHFLLPDSRRKESGQKKIAEFLSSANPLIQDPHFRAEESPLPEGALLNGPDFMNGLVYYQSSELEKRSGSAVGISLKTSASSAGPDHVSRLPLGISATAAYHHWMEHSREVVFNDLTLQNKATPVVFHGNRKLIYEVTQSLETILPPRASVIYTQGRPGAKMIFRNALLIERHNKTIQRSAALSLQMRHPRPVEIPQELFPYPPLASVGSWEKFNTCSMRVMDGPLPFTYNLLEWQDPLFNRKLLAAAQQKDYPEITIGLDRKIYAPADVIYPEIILKNPLQHPAISIEISLSVMREVAGKSESIEAIKFILPAGISDQEQSGLKDVRRWVYEIGLNQSVKFDGKLNVDVQNMDRLLFKVTIRENNSVSVITIDGIIRTDMEIWPQQQSAYAVIRKNDAKKESHLAAFGWLVKPRIVKRNDRFTETSWAGTFRVSDVFVSTSLKAEKYSYEIRTISSYGEQITKSI